MNSFLLKISVSWNSILTEFRKAKYSTFRSVVKVSPRIEIIFQEDIFPPIFKKSYELIFPRLVFFLTTQHNLSISRVFCESRHKFLLLSSFPVFRTRWKGFDNEENNFAFFFRSLERRSRREWLKKREKSNFFHFEFQSNSRCEETHRKLKQAQSSYSSYFQLCLSDRLNPNFTLGRKAIRLDGPVWSAEVFHCVAAMTQSAC